jgi:hypothetical protein
MEGSFLEGERGDRGDRGQRQFLRDIDNEDDDIASNKKKDGGPSFCLSDKLEFPQKNLQFFHYPENPERVRKYLPVHNEG